MQPFSASSRWIWHPDLRGDELDTRVCFRRTVEIPAHFLRGQTAAQLRITADSRYVVWIDGVRLGEGPPRYWPWRRHVDEYAVGGLLVPGACTIAAMVHSVGTATSSYVPGRGGLLAELVVDGKALLSTDASWETFIHPAYEQGPPRINVSQAFVERFDARRDPVDWQRGGAAPEGDKPSPAAEVALRAALELGPPEPATVTGPMGSPTRRLSTAAVDRHAQAASFTLGKIPPLREEVRSAQTVRHVRDVAGEPETLSIDFKRAFFPDDRSTEDKLQVGAVAVGVFAPTTHRVRIVRKNRRWPYETERFWVNGREFHLRPHTWGADLELQEGPNLVLFDVSGAYQRFWIDVILLSDGGARFHALDPLTELPAAAFGPFDHADIGNIVCAEGFAVNEDAPAYRALQEARSAADLLQHADCFKPLAENELCRDNAKLALEFRQYGGHRPILAVESPLRFDLSKGAVETHLDFGDEVSGFLELEIEAPEGTRIDGVVCEYHDEDHPELPDDLNNWFRYTSSAGRRSYRSTLRRGFRHLFLSVYPPAEAVSATDNAGRAAAGGAVAGPPRAAAPPHIVLYRVVCRERLYPRPVQGEFSCSDRQLTEIYNMSKRTVALCMEDTFVDCPGFEQALWIGDTRNSALMAYTLFGSYKLGRNSLTTAAYSLLRSALPESHVPSGVPLVLTAWSLLWMIACEEYVLHSGDTEFVTEIAPWLVEAAASIRGHINERDLLEISAWNMLDWAPMDTPYHGVVTHQNMLAVWALRSAARLLNEMTGDQQEAVARMRSAADRTADAINKHLWDDENAAYVDAIHADGSPSTVHSVQTHLMGLLSGVVPEGRRSHVEALVEFPPESFVVIGSPFMSFFLFRHLSDRQRYSAVLTAIREGWGAMIEEGSTTCWETFRGFYTDRLTRSYCHAWSSAPAWYLPEVVLGIRRLAPAWREVEVKPHLGDLDWAEGSVVTPQGPIFVRWRKRTDGAVDLKVVAPPGVQVRS